MIDCNEWKTEKPHESTNVGKVKGLELWWQLYHTSLPERDVRNIMPMAFVRRSVQRSSPQWWTHTPLAQSLRQFRGTRMLTNTIKATWMHVKVTLRPYWENEVICDKWIEGFPISWVWWCFTINCKVLCLVYYYSVGPYIPFIFLIGYFPDIQKITKIQTVF